MPGPWEMALILVIILILFGAGRLPQVLEQFGKGIKQFRDAQKEGEDPEGGSSSGEGSGPRAELTDDKVDDAIEVSSPAKAPLPEEADTEVEPQVSRPA